MKCQVIFRDNYKNWKTNTVEMIQTDCAPLLDDMIIWRLTVTRMCVCSVLYLLECVSPFLQIAKNQIQFESTQGLHVLWCVLNARAEVGDKGFIVDDPLRFVLLVFSTYVHDVDKRII